jgi:hypothetical protein
MGIVVIIFHRHNCSFDIFMYVHYVYKTMTFYIEIGHFLGELGKYDI